MVQRQTSKPLNAVRKNIGEVVTVQVFALDKDNPGQIKPETLNAFTGKLLSYQAFEGGFAFKIEGMPRQTYLYSTHLVEIYEQ